MPRSPMCYLVATYVREFKFLLFEIVYPEVYKVSTSLKQCRVNDLSAFSRAMEIEMRIVF